MNLFFKDFVASSNKIALSYVLGIQDITLRYKRSLIGPFWITINLFILGCCLTFIFGIILKQDVQKLIPHLFLGLIFWNFIYQTVNDGCTVFTGNAQLLQQINMPYLVLVFRVLIRNIIIFAHNCLIIPIVFLFFNLDLHINILLLAPNFLLTIFILFFIIVILGILNARFRDFESITQNIMNVFFYLTPIFWNVTFVDSNYHSLLKLNPFFHIIEFLRTPLISGDTIVLNYIFLIPFLFLLMCVGVFLFSKFKNRIIYWI